jgi:hypothetical protein
MRRVAKQTRLARIALAVIDWLLVTIYFATVIIGLSLLGAFVAFQIVDYQQSQVRIENNP